MPVLSFSVETGRGPLYLLIQTGQKMQTIRKPKKRPWKVGDELSLYWKQRTSPEKKMIHLIGTATLKSCTRMRAEDIWNDPDINIDWPMDKPILSSKDADYPRLKDIRPDKLPRVGNL